MYYKDNLLIIIHYGDFIFLCKKGKELGFGSINKYNLFF